MDNDINKQANLFLDAAEAKMGIEMLKEIIPGMVGINKTVYEEMKKQGFNDMQAFQFSCQYTIATMCGGQ